MKIITWNCNMAFRKKAAAILQYKPDILVVQECEHPDKLVFDAAVPAPTGCLWIGSNLNKGLGIFCYGDFSIKLLKCHNPELQLIAPVRIKGPQQEMLLLAIWAHNPNDKDGQYITQVWKALSHYKKIIRHSNTILTGDFNSNTIWDRPRRQGNHSAVVAWLENKKIHSVYHHYFSVAQGKEPHPTHYLYRHQQRPYHLDYCFVSQDLLSRLQHVEVGNYDTWKAYSDHVPVMVSFTEGEQP